MIKKKRFVILLVILVLVISSIVACNRNMNVKSNNKNEKNVEVEQNDEELIMDKYRKLVSQDKEPYQISKFVNDNISKVSKEYGSEMLLEFENVQFKFIKSYSEELFKGNNQSNLTKISDEFKFDFKNINKINDEKLKQFIIKIRDSQYDLIKEKDFYYPTINYEKLKKYSEYVTDEGKEYINIRSIESNNPVVVDDKLIVSWDEIKNRLLKIENYLKKYSNSFKFEELTRLYGNYLVLYMSGKKNMPIYDTNTNKVNQEVLTNYKKLIKNNGDTITGDKIKKYLDLIKDNNFVIDDKIKSEIIHLQSEAINKLEQYK